MLNHSSSNNTRIKVNAVSGTIVKNYRDSFFVRFQLGSKLGEFLLSEESTVHNRSTVVIQCMCAGGNNRNEIIAEVMWKEDFDKLFEHAEGVKENNERG